MPPAARAAFASVRRARGRSRPAAKIDRHREASRTAALNERVMDPYEILGITPAYEGDLRALRNRLVKRYFEAGPTPDEERMKAINIAYEELSARRFAPEPLSIATGGL